MVSNARLDLPEPDSPVTTTRRSRGISSETFLRLWTRAPCTAIVVRAAAFAFRSARLTAALGAILWSPRVEERQLLHQDVARPREPDRRRGLADELLVRQVLARRGHAADVEVALEVVLDLGARPRLADLAQVVDHRPEQRHRALRHVAVHRVQRRLHVLPRLPGVEQVGVDRLE